MSDLISRQAAIDHWRLIIDATNTDSRYNMGFVDGLEFCISHLITMPSVQPDIVRCKDCKHLQKWRSEESAKKFGQIYECARNVFDCPKREDFCSRAESRTDEPDQQSGG